MIECREFLVPLQRVLHSWSFSSESLVQETGARGLTIYPYALRYGLKAPAKCSISLDVLFDIWQHNSQQRFFNEDEVQRFMCCLYAGGATLLPKTPTVF